jgi:hypothetical protein
MGSGPSSFKSSLCPCSLGSSTGRPRPRVHAATLGASFIGCGSDSEWSSGEQGRAGPCPASPSGFFRQSHARSIDPARGSLVPIGAGVGPLGSRSRAGSGGGRRHRRRVKPATLRVAAPLRAPRTPRGYGGDRYGVDELRRPRPSSGRAARAWARRARWSRRVPAVTLTSRWRRPSPPRSARINAAVIRLAVGRDLARIHWSETRHLRPAGVAAQLLLRVHPAPARVVTCAMSHEVTGLAA